MLDQARKSGYAPDTLIGRDRSIPVFFVIQPNQYLNGSKVYSQEELERYVTSKDTEARANLYYPRIRALYAGLAQTGAMIDATDVFKNVSATMYRDDCCHMNEQGVRMLGERILNEIREKRKDLDIIPVSKGRSR